MKKLIFLGLFIVGCGALSYHDLVLEEWEEFKATFHKHYENETEEVYRMKIFMQNRHKVAQHNKQFAEGLVSYQLGINAYSDMLIEELVGCYSPLKDERDGVTYIPPANIGEVPDEVDWREKGAVTPAKNQGQFCLSCYAFGATGALEGQHFRKTGKLVSLSEQNIVDCSLDYGNNGCGKGHPVKAFIYVAKNEGIDTEDSYPYEGADMPCRFDRKNVGATDKNYVRVTDKSEETLKTLVATVGPVSVGVHATTLFQLYRGDDVFDDPFCSDSQKNHAVLIVGYGTTDNGTDYWILKNSYGETWGNKGFMKMARNKNNLCGVASDMSYPLV